jgi:hypothetical protein
MAFPLWSSQCRARAIECVHAMRTDGEIERLSEMLADSIVAAAIIIGPRHVPLAALREGYITFASTWKGPWPVLALFCRADRANQCPKSGGERTQRGHSRFRSVRDRTNLISYIDASSLDGLAARQPRGHWRHTPSPAQSPSRQYALQSLSALMISRG